MKRDGGGQEELVKNHLLGSIFDYGSSVALKEMSFVGWKTELRFGPSTFISVNHPRKSSSLNLYVQFCFGIGDLTVL